MPNDWVVYVENGWCLNKGCSLGGLAWYVLRHPLIQPVSILDQTGGLWWWQGQWAFHSHTPTHPHPAPSHRCSPICFSAALQGNQDSDTLWESGRQKDLHTKPGWGVYLICLQSLNLSAQVQKFKGIKFSLIVYIYLQQMIWTLSLLIHLDCCRKHRWVISRLSKLSKQCSLSCLHVFHDFRSFQTIVMMLLLDWPFTLNHANL